MWWIYTKIWLLNNDSTDCSGDATTLNELVIANLDCVDGVYYDISDRGGFQTSYYFDDSDCDDESSWIDGTDIISGECIAYILSSRSLLHTISLSGSGGSGDEDYLHVMLKM